ncbi:hypothetical protein DH2020_048477 [Rehmannia glutinosa]|uniref:Phospholipid/glycerol acyltransferase domain-containing protein n=1 Tax=Rehmannia glutinosa TaxID=99300 RepID=A0ABR0U6P0_REHGL
MAADDHSLSTPLLPPDHQPHVILTVHDHSDPPQYTSLCDDNPQALFQSGDEERHNPFAFIGAHDGFEVPGSSTIDPFRNHTPSIEGLYEWVKIVICLPLAAARLLLFGLSLLVGYLVTRLALHGWKDKQNPMPKWRCRLIYHWIKRRGKPALREIAPIVVSNHVIYVDRFSRSSRKHAVNEIKRKASSNQFPRVLLFPEGTTSNGRVLISFQLGAFIPGYPVQPVIVRYPYVHFDQSWGNVALAKLMFRMFTQFHNFMEVEYLPLVRPHENRKENALHFAQRMAVAHLRRGQAALATQSSKGVEDVFDTGHVMASALNVAQTSHSYGDFMLLAKAAESKQENPSVYMAEMAWVQSRSILALPSDFQALHLRALDAVDMLEIFLSMNPDASGYVEFHGFLRALRLKPCGLSEKMFGFIDVQKIGKITFKQFLVGSAHILKQPLFRRACELAFSGCDMNGKDYILTQELQDAVSLSIPNLNSDEVSVGTYLLMNPAFQQMSWLSSVKKFGSDGFSKLKYFKRFLGYIPKDDFFI